MSVHSKKPRLALLSGGLGRRLGDKTSLIPKALIEVAYKPFILHQFHLLKKNNIQEVVLCIGHLGHLIQEYIQDGKKIGLTVYYSFDGSTLKGTGGAISNALPLLGDIFWVMYGDTYLPISFEPILDYFNTYQKLSLMTVLKNKNQWDKSNVLFRPPLVKEYNKKNPSLHMNYIDYGLGIFRKEAFDSYSKDHIFSIGLLQQKLAQEKELLGFEVSQRFYEIGSSKGLKETHAYLLKKDSYEENR